MENQSQGGLEVNGGRLQDFTIDQLAGATALVLGSVGGLLMIIWKSRCACRVRLGCSDKCYIFDCERKPPPNDNGDSSEDEAKTDNPEKTKLTKESSRQTETEPEPEIDRLV